MCAFVCPAGSIIRCMRRLEEVLRQMCSAAKAIGNTELENKFAEGENILAPFEAVGLVKHPGEVSQAVRRTRLGSLQMFPGPANR